MRTKRSTPAGRHTPISAALGSRAAAGPQHEDDERQAQGTPGVVRLAALLGIGLTAAALLLPSGEPPVMVPEDTLQPAAGLTAAPDGSEDAGSPAAGPFDGTDGAAQTTPTAPASSSASVAGDDLEGDGRDQRQQPKAPRARTKPGAPDRARSTPKQRPRATTRQRTQRSASSPPTPTQATQPPPAATPVQPAPAPAKPRPSKPRGGPSAEFGL